MRTCHKCTALVCCSKLNVVIIVHNHHEYNIYLYIHKQTVRRLLMYIEHNKKINVISNQA